MGETIYLEADIKVEETTKALWEAASSVIDLPKEGEKQPDLLYFSAIFVSSGENLNHAFFTPSELVKAEGTIVNKALDVEHKEEEIIGHIYERAFMDKDGNPLELEDLASMEKASLDSQEMHIAIAGIIYKNRFPDIAKEVAAGKWKVSMEAYYQDYDVKVGDLVMSKKEAESLGLASDDSVLGKVAKVLKEGKEIAKGAVTRVLRGITFSGCGIVENPANPPSVILETAKHKEKEDDTEVEIVLDYATIEKDNNVTSSKVETDEKETSESEDTSVSKEENKEEVEKSELEHNDTVGICVNYQRYVYDPKSTKANSKIIHEDWCSRYDTSCTSFGHDATDPKCLMHKVKTMASACLKELIETSSIEARRRDLLTTLEKTITNAKNKDF